MLYLRFGLGRHAVVVAQEDPQNLSRFLQTIVANEIVYTTGLACARLSIVFLYYRIFGTSNMRYFLHGFTAIIIAWTIGTVSEECSRLYLTFSRSITQRFPHHSLSHLSEPAGQSVVSGTERIRTALTFTAFMLVSQSAVL